MKTRMALPLLLLILFVAFAWAQDLPPAEATPAPETTPAPEGMPAPPQAKPAAEQLEVVCPITGEKTAAWEITAFFSTGVDTDFCYIGASETYYQKMISTCASTGYTGYREDFPPELDNLPPKVVKNIKKKLPKMFNLEKIEPWDRYAILAQIYIWRGKKNKDIANAYLRATYTMRGLALGAEERKEEIYLREQAIHYLDRAARKAEFPLPELPQVKYLLGELNRRNGHFRKAIGHFDDVGKMKNRPEWIDEMVIRQKAKALAYDNS